MARKLLVTAFETDPNVISRNVADMRSPGRTGFYIVTPGQKQAAFHALPRQRGAPPTPAARPRLECQRVIDLGGRQGRLGRRFHDLEGRPVTAPAHDEELPDAPSALFPNGRLRAIERSASSAAPVIKDLVDSEMIPVRFGPRVTAPYRWPPGPTMIM